MNNNDVCAPKLYGLQLEASSALLSVEKNMLKSSYVIFDIILSKNAL